MRAFAIDQFGEAGSVRQLPEPTPQEGQVRVKVEAAALNPVDLGMSQGGFKGMMEHRFPLIPGMDVSGVVDSVGVGVTELETGDVVFGVNGKMVVGEGTLAEYVTASASTLARRPADVDAAFGAALGLAGASALQLMEIADFQPGDAVLVIGAAGGIGSFLLQLAAAAGVQPIAVTRAVNDGYVRDLGAVETIDYTTHDVFEAVRSTHPQGIAAIFDLVGNKEANNRLADLVSAGGHLVSMRGGSDTEPLAARDVKGVNLMTRTTADRLEQLAGYVGRGELRRPQIRTFRLEDSNQALVELEGGHLRGKLVVLP